MDKHFASSAEPYVIFSVIALSIGILANSATLANFVEQKFGWTFLRSSRKEDSNKSDEFPTKVPFEVNPDKATKPEVTPKPEPIDQQPNAILKESDMVYYVELDPNTYTSTIGCPKETGFFHPVESLIDGADVAISLGFFSPKERAMIGSIWQNEQWVYKDPTGPEAGCMVSLGKCLHISKPMQEIQIPFDCSVAFQAGPQLLPGTEGGNEFRPELEGYKRLLEQTLARRAAIGSNAQGRIILSVTKEETTLDDFRQELRRIGCVQAINLDGGSSAFLFYKGRYIIEPRKHLPFVLCFTKRDGNQIAR